MHEPQLRLVRISGLLVCDVLLYMLLVGGVLWVRIASEANTITNSAWPTPADVRLSWPRGVWLAALLLATSVTMMQALRSAENRACGARWLGCTLSIGLLFVAFQLVELRTRVRHNLVPGLIGTGIHNRADLYYLSATRDRLREIATELNAAAIKANATITNLDNAELSTTTREERLAVVNRLLTSELIWTESRISQQSSPQIADQRAAMIALAQDVFPTQAYTGSHRQFREGELSELARRLADAQRELVAARNRSTENSEPLKAKLGEVAERNRQLKAVRDQLKRLPPEDEVEEVAEVQGDELRVQEQAIAPDKNDRRTGLKQQLETLQPLHNVANAELTRVASLVTDADDAASQISAQIAATQGRQQMIADMPAEGLNQRYPWLQLPVAIPAGRNWSLAYFGLTLLHLAHVSVGLMKTLPRLARCERPLALVDLATYWYLQVLAGCVLLGLFYFI